METYNPSGKAGVIAAGISLLVWLILSFYYTTKAQFLAPAIVTNDADCSMKTALQRSRGHFWNLVLGHLCVISPLLILDILCVFLLYPLMQHLAGLDDIPLVGPFHYLPVYTYAIWGVFGAPAFIAQMTVVCAFYQRRDHRLIDAF